MPLRSPLKSDVAANPAAKHRCKAMTLVEVIVAILIISMFAASSVSLMLQNQKRTLANFYRLEAYRLAQTIAEHAMQAPYPAGFTVAGIKATTAVGTRTVWMWTDSEQAMLRSLSLGTNQAQFAYPAGSSAVVFNKVIEAVADVGSAKVLKITINWAFVGRPYSIFIYVVRGS